MVLVGWVWFKFSVSEACCSGDEQTGTEGHAIGTEEGIACERKQRSRGQVEVKVSSSRRNWFDSSLS